MTKSKLPKAAQEFIAKIARDVLLIDTLKTRGRDSLDFHDLPVGAVRYALEIAYLRGKEDGQRE